MSNSVSDRTGGQPAGAPSPKESTGPWWRYKIVFLVFGLPLCAVIGSVTSGVIAWTHVNPVISEAEQARALAAEDVAEHGHPGMEAAEKARNHVMTPRP